MKRGNVICISIFCLIALTGCWDHTPVEETAFVVMLGLDPDPAKPTHTILTQMIALPQAQPQGQSGGQGGASPYYLVSQSGITLTEAQTEALRHVPRFIELAHAQIVMFGEEYARDGVDKALDWLLRQSQVRFALSVMVSRGAAQELMQAQPKLESLPPVAIEGIMREADPIAITFDVFLHEFTRKVLSEREDAVIPVVDRIDPMTASVPGGSSAPPGTKGNEIYAVGLAVFKGARMVGMLEGASARGAVWVQGRSLAAVNVPHPTHQDHFVSVSFAKARSKVAATVEGEQLNIQIEIELFGNVFEVGVAESIAAGRFFDGITSEVEDAVKREVQATLDEVQLLGADIFGVGEKLYRNSPEAWRRLASRWDEVYRQATVDIAVNAHITWTGFGR